MTQQALFINDAHPGIVQLLPIWQISQAFEIKRHQEFLRRHEGVRRTSAGTARAGGNKVTRMQPPNQVTADLFPKNVLQPIARNRLVEGHGSQNGDVELARITAA